MDIGGTNIRAGVVRLLLDSANDLSKAKVWKFERWRHGDEKLSRGDAVEALIKMLQRLISRARRTAASSRRSSALAVPARSKQADQSKLEVQPARKLGASICLMKSAEPFLESATATTAIIMHNDAVAQGLSETPFMKDVSDLGHIHHRYRTRQCAVQQ